MAYITVTEAQSNPFAPLTAELVKQLRDNPLAIAEGLAGAPRNVPLSLDLLIGGSSFALSGTTPIEFVGLANLGSLLVVASASGFDVGATPTEARVQIAFSLDNGGAWSGWNTIVAATGEGNHEGVNKHIHLSEGLVDCVTISGAAGANAVRFRKHVADGGGRVMVFGMGRT